MISRHALRTAACLALFAVSCGTPQAEPGELMQPTEPPAHLPFFDTADFTPRWLDPAAVPDDFHRIPPFAMRNQRDEPVTEAVMDGHITVVDFFFATCRGICPRLAESMQQIDDAFADDASLTLLSYSVMPEHDTVEVLADYAQTRQLDSDRWHLLTGDRSTIYALGRRSYFIEESMGLQRDDDQFLHTENLVLLDRQRRIRGVYSGTNRTATAQLIADAQQLLADE